MHIGFGLYFLVSLDGGRGRGVQMTDAVTHFGTFINIFIILYIVIILTFSAFTLVLSILHSSTLSGCGSILIGFQPFWATVPVITQ